jgi:hypothetical protein
LVCVRVRDPDLEGDCKTLPVALSEGDTLPLPRTLTDGVKLADRVGDAEGLVERVADVVGEAEPLMEGLQERDTALDWLGDRLALLLPVREALSVWEGVLDGDNERDHEGLTLPVPAGVCVRLPLGLEVYEEEGLTLDDALSNWRRRTSEASLEVSSSW